MPLIGPLRLLVEGWRFIPHSYAIVNQFQLLELLALGQIAVAHWDLPFNDPAWQLTAGMFTEAQEKTLRQIRTPTADESFDAIYRIAYPYDLKPSDRAARTSVFATAELGMVPPQDLTAAEPLASACSKVQIVTPSNWSKEGFVRSGADPNRVVVISHGVDTDIFSPASSEERAELRRRFGWNDFIFLNIGAMTGNKGITLLLKAFAVLTESFPDAKLVLKGMDALYGSRQRLDAALHQLTRAEVERVRPRLQYDARVVTMAEMANLYRAADAYVTPYAAEGFSLPSLEAIACGLPLICTRGGATDDFASDAFALRIDSSPLTFPIGDGVQAHVRQPNFDHLVALMKRVIEVPHIATRARIAGPAHARALFTWRHVVEKLTAVLFE